MTKNKATIFLPVYNGERDHLRETLEAIFSQKADFSWNVYAIDSGSKDGSVKILREFSKKYNNFRFSEIPNKEYSHGGTRQKAAEESDGEIMVYLSQDAIPVDKNWLKNIVAPFEISRKVAGVLARQVPRDYCFPLQKKDINNVFAAQGVAGAVTLYDKNSEDHGRASFYSDVCSAARREILVEKVPYRNISYSEDQAFGKDIIERGFIKVYADNARVNHSNDIRLSEYKGRIVDEFLGLEKTGIKLAKPSRKNLFREITFAAMSDMKFTLKDRQYSRKQKLYYFVTAPIFRFKRWSGMNAAFKHEEKYSLEESRK